MGAWPDLSHTEHARAGFRFKFSIPSPYYLTPGTSTRSVERMAYRQGDSSSNLSAPFTSPEPWIFRHAGKLQVVMACIYTEAKNLAHPNATLVFNPYEALKDENK